MSKPLIRFQKLEVKGSLLEWHQATYGGLVFNVVLRQVKHQPPKVRASIALGDPSVNSKAPYYASNKTLKTVEDGKFWCRCALSYILRGVVPFGDHDKEITE